MTKLANETCYYLKLWNVGFIKNVVNNKSFCSKTNYVKIIIIFVLNIILLNFGNRKRQDFLLWNIFEKEDYIASSQFF
jgi:hypothetical protein